MFSKFMGLLRTWGGRHVMGVDTAGNSYFRKPNTVDGVWAEKRWVEFKGKPDPTTIPVEWTSWLAGTRKNAPTWQEMIDLEAKRHDVKLKAALLQQEEDKQRFRSKVLQQSEIADNVSPQNMKRMMRQMSASEATAWQPESLNKLAEEALKNQQPGRTSDIKDSSTSHMHKQTYHEVQEATRDKFEPEKWKP